MTNKMKSRIVSSKELKSCPQLRLDPKHYIPEHKIEECHKELIQEVKKFERKQGKELENFKKSLRV